LLQLCPLLASSQTSAFLPVAPANDPKRILSAEFETNLRRERQLEGIAKTKAPGVYKRRPAQHHAQCDRDACRVGAGLSNRSARAPAFWAVLTERSMTALRLLTYH